MHFELHYGIFYCKKLLYVQNSVMLKKTSILSRFVQNSINFLQKKYIKYI